MQIPKIGDLMTPAPKTIGEDIPVAKAKDYMRRENFRHLPVLQAGRLVGIVSDRDIKVAESFTGKGELTVGEVMTPDPYVVDEGDAADEVLLTMADRKYGCVLVQRRDSGALIGIFTDTDCLHFCGNLLKQYRSERAA